MKAPIHYMLLPVLDGFGATWELADEALAEEFSADPIEVSDGGGSIDRAGLAALRDLLAAKLNVLRGHQMSERIAHAVGVHRRAALHRALKLFSAAARTWWGDTVEAAAIPQAQPVDRNLDKFLQPVRDALRLWDRFNDGPAPAGVTLPLTLGEENVDRAGMAALMAQLLQARDDEEEAVFLQKLARRERDLTERRALAVLSQLQKTIVIRLGSDHAVVDGMPALHPPRRTARKRTAKRKKEAAAAVPEEAPPAAPVPVEVPA